MLRRIALVIGLLSALSVQAETQTQVTHENEYPAVKNLLDKLDVKNTQIKKSPLDGFVQVDLDSERGLVYISEDGHYLLTGNLYRIDDAHIVDLTRRELNKKLNAMQDTMVIYPAKNEKYVISAFVDSSCYYCQKLHDEIEAFNKEGITVRFLAFPRDGDDPTVADEMAQAWCATDAPDALSKLMKGEKLKNDGSECHKIVENQLRLGKQMGVRATPAIILDDGTLVPGFIEADKLKKYLESRVHK